MRVDNPELSEKIKGMAFWAPVENNANKLGNNDIIQEMNWKSYQNHWKSD